MPEAVAERLLQAMAEPNLVFRTNENSAALDALAESQRREDLELLASKMKPMPPEFETAFEKIEELMT